jgi:hypothetical protein
MWILGRFAELRASEGYTFGKSRIVEGDSSDTKCVNLLVDLPKARPSSAQSSAIRPMQSAWTFGPARSAWAFGRFAEGKSRIAKGDSPCTKCISHRKLLNQVKVNSRIRFWESFSVFLQSLDLHLNLSLFQYLSL